MTDTQATGERDRVEEDQVLKSENELSEKVVLNIDYRIIEHFSDHLYSSENKAVEELVSNGFDAQATKVYVYTPGKYVSDRVVVWDNGWSMDVGGLKDLWSIASSPKEEMGRVARAEGRRDRRMIGKFGIGKLASYVVGNSILHLCHKNGRYLVVSVDYGKIRGEGGHRPPSPEDRNVHTEPIYELSESEARAYVEGLFREPDATDAMALFEEDSWTLAVIGDLKVERMPPGRLSWVLGNGLPLRPDFNVWVDEEKVKSKLGRREDGDEWDFSHERLKGQLRKRWEQHQKEKGITEDLKFDDAAGLDDLNPEASIPYVEFPNLGKVWGATRIFDDSLEKGRASEQGRSQGFFIIVLGRLINPNDAEFFLRPPQFGAFNRSQFELHVDGLDEVLLADRKSIQEDTPHAEELKLLQQAVYLTARAELDNRDTASGDEPELPATLPVKSREHYRQPLVALLATREDTPPSEFPLSDPKIAREALGEDERISRVAPKGEGFEVNVSHPLFKSLDAELGGRSKKSRLFDEWYDLFAVSDLLLEGHLHDSGMSLDAVDRVVEWRDDLLRELAHSYSIAPSELARELESASYAGDDAFEEALAAVLRGMGFDAERIGGPDAEDVFLRATFGPDSYSLVFEAKGRKKGALEASDANVSTVDSQRKDVGAKHAVVVAREFQGFRRNPTYEDARILKNCRRHGTVSIMTVEALNRLLKVVRDFQYPLDGLYEVFAEIEPPQEKLERIETLEDPTDDFDYLKLLKLVKEEQAGRAERELVYYGPIRQEHWKEMDPEEFDMRLQGLESLAGGLIRLNTNKKTVALVQSPEQVAERIRSRVEDS